MWMGWTGIRTPRDLQISRRIIREKPEQMVSYERTLMDMNGTRELRTGMIAVVRWDEGKWSDVSVTDSSAPRWVYMMLYQISARWLVSWWVRRSDCLVCWFQWYCDIGLIWHFMELFWVFDISDLRNVERTWPVNSKEWNFEAEFYRCGLKIWMLLELFSLLFREHV